MERDTITSFGICNNVIWPKANQILLALAVCVLIHTRLSSCISEIRILANMHINEKTCIQSLSLLGVCDAYIHKIS